MGTKTFSRKEFDGKEVPHNEKASLLEEQPPPDTKLQLRLLHDRFPPYKTQSSSTKRTLLKLRG